MLNIELNIEVHVLANEAGAWAFYLLIITIFRETDGILRKCFRLLMRRKIHVDLLSLF